MCIDVESYFGTDREGYLWYSEDAVLDGNTSKRVLPEVLCDLTIKEATAVLITVNFSKGFADEYVVGVSLFYDLSVVHEEEVIAEVEEFVECMTGVDHGEVVLSFEVCEIGEDVVT